MENITAWICVILSFQMWFYYLEFKKHKKEIIEILKEIKDKLK